MNQDALTKLQADQRDYAKKMSDQKAKERSDHVEYQKKLKQRQKLSDEFNKFIKPDNFNLNLYRLRERSVLPSCEEVKNILGNISEVELDSLVYCILTQFKHWGKDNSYEWRENVRRTFRGDTLVYQTPPEPGKIIGTYSHKE